MTYMGSPIDPFIIHDRTFNPIKRKIIYKLLLFIKENITILSQQE